MIHRHSGQRIANTKSERERERANDVQTKNYKWWEVKKWRNCCKGEKWRKEIWEFSFESHFSTSRQKTSFRWQKMRFLAFRLSRRRGSKNYFRNFQQTTFLPFAILHWTIRRCWQCDLKDFASYERPNVTWPSPRPICYNFLATRCV